VFPIPLNVSLGQSKIKNEDFMGRFIQSHTKVIWLDISVDEMPVVDVLNPGDHLVNEH